MPLPGKAEIDALRFNNGPSIVFGRKATRAAVAAEHKTAPIGTFYISSVTTGGTGRVYVKVTESGGASGTATDWEKVTTSAAD